MALRYLSLLPGVFVLFSCFLSSSASDLDANINPLYPKAINDLKEDIVKRLGFDVNDVKVTGFDTRDALVEHSLLYEFEIEIDNKIIPLKLVENVNRWEYVDFPIFQIEDPLKSSDEHGLIYKQKLSNSLPVLAPFQLVGPMELWIQDAEDMRFSLPNDVDAGIVKKVILADGAAVTVKGARCVSLRRPLNLTLPLNRTHHHFPSGLLSLSQRLRHSTPLLSLRIVSPASLNSVSHSINGLKIKRIAPGLVELSQKTREDEMGGMLWPLGWVNGGNGKVAGLEALLVSILGGKGKEEGWFGLGKVEVRAERFVKMGFGIQRDGAVKERMWFEVVGRVEGERVVAEKIVRVRRPKSVIVEDTIAPNVILGNISSSPSTPALYPPPNTFTL